MRSSVGSLLPQRTDVSARFLESDNFFFSERELLRVRRGSSEVRVLVVRVLREVRVLPLAELQFEIMARQGGWVF